MISKVGVTWTPLTYAVGAHECEFHTALFLWLKVIKIKSLMIKESEVCE